MFNFSGMVRKMDVDLSHYRKLTDTLPVTVSREGLEIVLADLTLILLRFLPEDCRSYVMLRMGHLFRWGRKSWHLFWFAVERSDGTQDSQEFQLECNIGQTAHNIISTTQLMKKGWTFVQSNSGSFLVHEPTKTFIGEVL